MKKLLKNYRKIFWSPEKYARYIGVKIGNNCSIKTKSFSSEPYLIEIGDNVQITNDATLNERLQILRNANFNQFFGYSYFDGYTGNGSTIYDRAFNHEYAAVYGDWFDILNG